MGQEKSLNDPIKSGESDEWQDWLVDDSLDQELIISQKQEYDDKKELLKNAMNVLNERENKIAQHILKEINERLNFLLNVGLNYLTLSRESGTLSGGQAQRIRQIETKAFEKLQKSMINASQSKNLLPQN